MELKPIRKNITLKDQAYEQIRQAINTNTLKPGTALTEEQLSSMLSISRTPIRSALQQLVYEKLLSQDATGHIYVSTITEKSVQDTSKVRTVLECMAIDSAVFPLSAVTVFLEKFNFGALAALPVVTLPVNTEVRTIAMLIAIAIHFFTDFL